MSQWAFCLRFCVVLGRTYPEATATKGLSFEALSDVSSFHQAVDSPLCRWRLRVCDCRSDALSLKSSDCRGRKAPVIIMYRLTSSMHLLSYLSWTCVAWTDIQQYFPLLETRTDLSLQLAVGLPLIGRCRYDEIVGLLSEVLSCSGSNLPRSHGNQAIEFRGPV